MMKPLHSVLLTDVYAPQGALIMILEISYTLKTEKDTKPVESWTYFTSDKDDFKSAVKEAGKHFKEFVRDNGWTRKAKLKSILQMKSQ